MRLAMTTVLTYTMSHALRGELTLVGDLSGDEGLHGSDLANDEHSL